jgi:uncharacterized phage protein (TIGR01671 family)
MRSKEGTIVRDILFRALHIYARDWVYGGINQNGAIYSDGTFWDVDRNTIGQYTGLCDKNGTKIFEGDIVKFFGYVGEVIQDDGAFMIFVKDYIDYNLLSGKIKEITGCDNAPRFCENDNVISFWELMWNYNQEASFCDVVEVISNIHDNPEL